MEFLIRVRRPVILKGWSLGQQPRRRQTCVFSGPFYCAESDTKGTATEPSECYDSPFKLEHRQEDVGMNARDPALL